MYDDFYAFIPGSLAAKERLKKLRLKRLGYSLGAIVIFGSGFLLGLVWQDPSMTRHELASTSEHPFEVALTPPVATELLQVHPVSSSLEFLPTPPSEPVGQMIATLSLPEPAGVSAQVPDQAEALVQAEAVIQTEAASQPDTPKPDVPKVQNHESQPMVADVKVVVADVKAAVAPVSSRVVSQPYLVQVGAFQNEANARAVATKLREKGYHPFIRAVRNARNLVLHRVFIERVNDRAQARAAAKAFEMAEKMDALVMLADHVADHRAPISR